MAVGDIDVEGLLVWEDMDDDDDVSVFVVDGVGVSVGVCVAVRVVDVLGVCEGVCVAVGDDVDDNDSVEVGVMHGPASVQSTHVE